MYVKTNKAHIVFCYKYYLVLYKIVEEKNFRQI